MARVTTNRQQQAVANDTDFQDIWKYLKWLRRGYDVGASAADLPTTRELASRAMDYFSGGGTETGAGGGAAVESAAPAWEGAIEAYPAGAEAGLGGGGAVAAEGGAEMGLGGMASLAAPLVMAYLKYQAGSGRNDPLIKRTETQGAVPLLKNTLAGQPGDANDLWANYRLPNKWMPSQNGGPSETIDQTPYSVSELYHMMHNRGKGHSQQGGTGSSGYSDAEIDDMILGSGVSEKDLLAALKIDKLPDWNKYSYDTWFANTFRPEYGENKQWV